MNILIEWKVTKVFALPPETAPNTMEFLVAWDCQAVVDDAEVGDSKKVVRHSIGRSLIKTKELGLGRFDPATYDEDTLIKLVKDVLGEYQVGSLEKIVRESAIETVLEECGSCPTLPWVPVPEPYKPTPEQVSSETYYHAVARLAESFAFSSEIVRRLLTEESALSVVEYQSKLAVVVAKAKLAVDAKQAYAPELPTFKLEFKSPVQE